MCGCIPFEAAPSRKRVRRPASGPDCSCGRPKPMTASFCAACRVQLPGYLKKQLYEATASEYPATLERAKDWLRKNGR
jgi:molybdenum cofactor biosynthesis enzyme MoaA